jgi:hypothetical protein
VQDFDATNDRLGHNRSLGRPLADVRSTPTSGAKADIAGGPSRAITGREQMQQTTSLFNHLVGAAEQRPGNLEAKRLCSDQIDDKIEFGRLLDREVTRFRSP